MNSMKRSHSQEEEGSEFKPRLIQSPGFALSSAYGTPNTITLTDPVLSSRHRGGRRLVTVQEFRQKRPPKWSFLSSFLATLRGLWGLGLLTEDRTHDPCTASEES